MGETRCRSSPLPRNSCLCDQAVGIFYDWQRHCPLPIVARWRRLTLAPKQRSHSLHEISCGDGIQQSGPLEADAHDRAADALDPVADAGRPAANSADLAEERLEAATNAKVKNLLLAHGQPCPSCLLFAVVPPILRPWDEGCKRVRAPRSWPFATRSQPRRHSPSQRARSRSAP